MYSRKGPLSFVLRCMKLTLKPSNFVLANAANLHGQPELVAKSARVNLSPSHKIPDCVNSYKNNLIWSMKIWQTMVKVWSHYGQISQRSCLLFGKHTKFECLALSGWVKLLPLCGFLFERLDFVHENSANNPKGANPLVKFQQSSFLLVDVTSSNPLRNLHGYIFCHCVDYYWNEQW